MPATATTSPYRFSTPSSRTAGDEAGAAPPGGVRSTLGSWVSIGDAKQGLSADGVGQVTGARTLRRVA